MFDAWGTTVNLASRIEAVAPPDGIATDEVTASALAGRYRVSGLRLRDLKGIGPTSILLVEC